MNKTAWELIARFHEEGGQALAEYALILAFIFAVCVFSVGALGVAIAGGLDSLPGGFSP